MRVGHQFIYIAFLFLSVNSPAQKQETKEIAIQYLSITKPDSFEERHSIESNYIRFYKGSSKQLNFQNISNEANQERFVPLQNIRDFEPFTDYWLNIRFDNPLKKDKTLILFLGFITWSEIYIQYANGCFEIKKSGIFTPNLQLDPNEGQEAKVSVLLPAQSKVTVYIKFRNDLLYPPSLSLAVQSQESWQTQMNQTNLIQGIFQGLLWMLLLYNLFLYLSIRDDSYLCYVFFVFFVSLYFLNEYEYLEEYFLSSSPQLSFHLANLIYIAMVFYIQFNRLFLNTPKDAPRWDILMQIWLFISIFFAIISFPLSYIAFDIYVNVRNNFHLFYTFSILLLVILVFVNSRNAVSRFFVAGNFCVLFGGVFIVLGNLEIIPFSLYYLLGGVAAQLFVFTLALSYRFRQNLLETQKLQGQLIAQLQENEKIQSEANRQLEQKVRERTAEIELQKEEIETQNEVLHNKSRQLESAYTKITDSIRYAQRLQSAILGEESKIFTYFKETFVLNLPRDMVSGDFYWSSKVGNKIIIIAADCTGHGIPAALMTILGHTSLNDIVNDSYHTSPDEILRELDKKVITILQKQSSNHQHKDGMDLVVLVFDEETDTLQFAGAHNPLYYVRDFEMYQIKGSNYPIGISDLKKNKHFELQELKIQKGDIFYLSSDGFQDQFGGTEHRKYLKKKFRDLLLKNSHLALDEQKIKLYDEFEAWKGTQKQTDDVLVIGIKI